MREIGRNNFEKKEQMNKASGGTQSEMEFVSRAYKSA